MEPAATNHDADGYAFGLGRTLLKIGESRAPNPMLSKRNKTKPFNIHNGS